VALGIAVPDPEDRVAGRGARPGPGPRPRCRRSPARRGVLEVGDARAGELALELALLGHEDLLVLLGHLVLGVLAQVAVLARRGDGLRVLGDLLGDDGLVLLALALEALRETSSCSSLPSASAATSDWMFGKILMKRARSDFLVSSSKPWLRRSVFARSRAVSGSAVESRSAISSVSSLRMSPRGIRRALAAWRAS
jgi:hypothetical protein